MHRTGFSAVVGTGACCGRQSGRRRDPQRSWNRQKYAGLERQPRAGQSRSVRSYPAHAIRAYHLSPQQGSGSGLVTQCAAVSGAAREHTIMVARHDRPDICWSVRCSPWVPAPFFTSLYPLCSSHAPHQRTRGPPSWSPTGQRTAAVGETVADFLHRGRPLGNIVFSSILAGIVHLFFFLS